MPDTPKLRVYVVAALFSPAEVPDGKMITKTWFAPDPHGATAAVAVRFVQQTGETQPLQTVMVHELTEEWLVAALNAIRTGGKPGEVTPLRVVPEAMPRRCGDEEHDWIATDTGHKCRKCAAFTLPYQAVQPTLSDGIRPPGGDAA